jgi:hypothetical protein
MRTWSAAASACSPEMRVADAIAMAVR